MTGSRPATDAPVIVAVDVGGSGLRVQTYAAGPGPVLTAPGVRIGREGIDVPQLVTATRRLLDTGLTASADVVVWSMRGLLFLADKAEVLAHVKQGLPSLRTVVASDAVTSLVGAMGGFRPGAVVAAGTGAVAFGSDFEDRWNRIDGWGHVLGDRGSAAWVGLHGLQAALAAEDGLPGGSPTLLSAGVDRLGPVETWPRQVMTRPDAAERLAGLAPLVTAAAAVDPVAATICSQAGHALAGSLLAAAKGLDAPTLVATGGLLAAEPVSTALDAHLTEAGRRREPARGTALDGAVVLGRQLLVRDRLPGHPGYLLVA